MGEQLPLEYCFVCDEPTGCAGRADDSHYNEDGEGPFCWDCWCKDENPRLHEQLDDAEAKNKELAKALQDIIGVGKTDDNGEGVDVILDIAEQALKGGE